MLGGVDVLARGGQRELGTGAWRLGRRRRRRRLGRRTGRRRRSRSAWARARARLAAEQRDQRRAQRRRRAQPPRAARPCDMRTSGGGDAVDPRDTTTPSEDRERRAERLTVARSRRRAAATASSVRGIVGHDAVHAERGDRIPLRVAVERVDDDPDAGARAARRRPPGAPAPPCGRRRCPRTPASVGGAHDVVGNVLEDEQPRHDLRRGRGQRERPGIEARRPRRAARGRAPSTSAIAASTAAASHTPFSSTIARCPERCQHVEELARRSAPRVPANVGVEPRAGVERAHLRRASARRAGRARRSCGRPWRRA